MVRLNLKEESWFGYFGGLIEDAAVFLDSLMLDEEGNPDLVKTIFYYSMPIMTIFATLLICQPSEENKIDPPGIHKGRVAGKP